ncbi:MAG: IS110 family transposase [Verrucomicrobiales bacterium]|jgi:transposase|nr:IS110 family transposase [Verrucomicrobiales bacterium]
MSSYTGIDWHKQYSVCYSVDEEGNRLGEGRINGNDLADFQAYFARLPGPHAVVHEACWHWAKLHELLEQVPDITRLVLSHPYKTRLIAEAQIKTDRLDAKALATLLRGNLIATVHVPGRELHQRKHVLRERLQRTQLRTMVRNRIHNTVDRQHDLPLPHCRDLFGRKGLAALKEAKLPDAERQILADELALHTLLQTQIRATEQRIVADHEQRPTVQRLQSLPGVGKILGAVIAAEIDTVTRFISADKLCAYAGLVPTTHASGGKIRHGKLLPFCNQHLRWAFVEAAWVAVGCSPYFGAYYHRQRARGKPANTAIMITARRMCQIVWRMLKEERDFCPAVPAQNQRPRSLAITTEGHR